MILDLKYFGEKILRKKCAPVKEITEDVKTFIQDLIESVEKHNGAGLAAPQVGKDLRIFVIVYDNGADEEGRPIVCPPKVYINPKISEPSDQMVTYEEGCLSIPGVYEKVKRPQSITVEAMGPEGNMFKEKATGWRARVIMHENDHINGVLFTDRVLPKIKKKIEPVMNALKKKYAQTK